SILMSLGMIMVPPVTISLPIKLLLFLLIDGWSLLFEVLIRSTH
ncbi:flagellar biosynthetic protein FliP, partial [Klebsiella pneumoniae]|nr:flagellar biosynthetic protein FliP [Klebsiella pneumoniae]